LNQYDDFDRLIISTQPQKTPDGNPLQTLFNYNVQGQLESSSSPDEGLAQFKYRNNGQIRFSQNAEQVKVNSFSYTNYDYLGRPVESGVYTGNDISYTQSYDSFGNALACVDNILDELDSLPQDGRSEQTFSVYDLPDPNLKDSLIKCNLPYASYNQTFLSGNVSYTYTQNPDTAKTWYSYDVYGRVVWMDTTNARDVFKDY
jgi:YD repeat-containing protein